MMKIVSKIVIVVNMMMMMMRMIVIVMIIVMMMIVIVQTWKKAQTCRHCLGKIFENCGNFWIVECICGNSNCYQNVSAEGLKLFPCLY